ncbi:GvpL/GvpF family gas vesicle protein [Streptomyces sp. NPDC004647]|uniref:GvpL/GvpF family gas vesicle protein n=1 Tax=Streptomyces sp. NPDC004647 TaxID=3154671 RepID=UPI0033AC4D95
MTATSCRADSATAATAGAPATATYVYAVCRDCDPAVLEGLAGQGGGSPVRLLAAGSLTAVVQDVSAEEFSESSLQQRLADRDELERCARAHHAVVTAAAAAGPAVPLPLATLYLGDERARTALLESEGQFRVALERIAGRVEWGVKVYAVQPQPQPHPQPVPAAAPAPPTARAAERPPKRTTAPEPGAGRAYLDRVRGRQQARELRYDAALRAAETVDATLRGIAVAARRLRPHGAESTGDRRTQVLNAAYLVAAGRDHELAAALEPLRQDTGVQIEISGPWVPYSFTDGGTG